MKLTAGILSLSLMLTCGSIAFGQTEATSEKTPATDSQEKSPRTYRLNYTITESDGSKRIGTQHFALTATGDRKEARAKLGSRVPIVTGSYNTDKTGVSNQFQYVDIGLSISASIREFQSGVEVFSKFEQSSLAEEKSLVGSSDPVIRQATLENTALLTADKPIVLGSLDIPGSTRHLDVEVVLEIVK